MKHWVTLSVAAAMVSCADPAEPAGASPGPPTRVYVTLVSHNETFGNAPCDRVLGGGDDARERYLANRSATVGMAEKVVAAEAAWNLQSDWQYLDRVAEYDVGEVLDETDGKNLMEWVAERAPGMLAVDTHSHEAGGFNFADVAALLEDLGVPTSGIVGGYIANPSEEADWERFRDDVEASKSNYVFRADALWGGGSADHVDDPKASGIWRPRDADHFFEDDPSQSLPNIGGYTGDLVATDGVHALLDMLRAGELEEGRMYTATIMVAQCDLDLDGALDEVQSVLDDLAPEVHSGDLVWSTLADVRSTWLDTYDAQPVVLIVED